LADKSRTIGEFILCPDLGDHGRFQPAKATHSPDHPEEFVSVNEAKSFRGQKNFFTVLFHD